jgi:hypothetical protein
MKTQIDIAKTGIDFTTKDDLVSLTDIFKQAQVRGLVNGKMEPKKWGQAPYAKKSGSTGVMSISGGPGRDFIDFVAVNSNVNAAGIWKTTRGNGGGTFAHKQIALAYAKYLSPALHMEVNDVFMKVQAASPEIADSIVDRMSQEDLKRHIARSAGVATRKDFTGKLQSHGVTGQGFGDCTNAMYVPLFNGTAKELRRSRNLSEKSNVRDSMSARELVTIAFAELLAIDKVEAQKSFGNHACVFECNKAAQSVASQLTLARGM